MRPSVYVAVLSVLVASCMSTSTPATTAMPPTSGTVSDVSSASSNPVRPDPTPPAPVPSPDATSPPSSSTITIRADTTPPLLEVTEPRPRATVTESQVRFRGVTEPGATVVAAGRYQADVAADGKWSIVLILNPGGNVATFVATDGAGNESEVRVPLYLLPCGDNSEAEIPEGAENAAVLIGDLDGDGASDSVTTYLADGRWRLHLELAYGWATEIDMTDHVTIAPPPEPVRMVDMGLPVVVVRLGGNLVGASFGLVALSGCELRPVVGPDGRMPEIWVGIGIHHSEFFRCESRAITQVQLGRNETWIGITETRYPFSPDSVSFGSPTVTEEQVQAPPIPMDGTEDSAWKDEVAGRRTSACLPW